MSLLQKQQNHKFETKIRLNTMKKLFLTVALLLLVVGAYAQKKVLKEADKAFKKGELDAAIQLATQATQDPETGQTADPYTLLGGIYLQKFISGGKESFEDAEKSFEWYTKAMEVGDDKVDETIMEEAMLSPADPNKVLGGEALGALEIFLIDESNKALEVEDYEKSYKFLELATRIRSDVSKDFFVAYAADNAGNAEVALEFYKKVVASEEEYENKNYAYNYVIQNQLDNEQYDEALKNIKEAQAAFPEDNLYQQWEVDVLIKSNKMDEAIEGLKSLINAGGAEKNIYYMLAYLQWNNDEFAAALENAKKAIEMDPNYGDAIYVAGSAIYNQGAELMTQANAETDDDAKYKQLKEQALQKFKDAMPYFEKAIEIDPNDVYSLRPLSTIYDQLEMDAKRDAILDRLDKLEGGDN